MSLARKALIVIAAPIVAIFILTAIGLALHNLTLIGLAGFSLLFLAFIGFACADSILNGIRSFRTAASNYSHLGPSTKALVDFIAGLPESASVFLRGLCLSLGFWIVSVFVGFCKGGIDAFSDLFANNVLATAIGLGVSLFDSIRGKTLKDPGLPTRVLSIVGAFKFYRGLYILGGAVMGRKAFEAIYAYLSSPLWFIFELQRYRMVRLFLPLGLGGILMIGMFHLFLLIGSAKVILEPKTGINVDAKNFAIAAFFFCAWMLIMPIISIGSFIQYLMTHGF